MEHTKGRVTIPTDIDVIPETLTLMDRWGQMQSETVMVLTFPKSFGKWTLKYIRLIIQHEKIMHGRWPIRMKYSRCM